MIKRINVLKGIGRFSALNFERGSEGDFSDLNVIYASNASGKSTLCDVLRSLGTGNPAYVMGRRSLSSDIQPEVVVLIGGERAVRLQEGQWHNHDNCPSIHVYDDRFVAENVFIGHHISVDQRRNLYGLVIGEEAIALKQAVGSAEQRLSNATTAFNAAQSALTRLIPTGYTIDSFRNLASVDDVDTEIAEATREYRTAEQTKTKADAIRARRRLVALPIAEVPETLDKVLSSTLDTASLAAEAKIRDHLAATSQGLSISWVQQGFDAQIGTTCPHCGQDMQGLDILEAYRAFFSGELQAQEQLRESMKSAVQEAFGAAAQNQIRQTLTSHKTEQNWWKDAAGFEFVLPEIDGIETIIALLQATYQAIDSVLARKQANPGSEVSLTDEEAAAVTAWNEKVVALKAYNKALNAINEELENRQVNAGVIDLAPLQQKLSALQAAKKRHEQETINAFNAFDAASAEKRAAQQGKQRANDALREQSNRVFERYGSRINEILRIFGADFRIAPDGVSFRGGTPAGQLAIELNGERVAATPEAAADPSQVSLANTLSGGDRSTLALAFFLAKMEMASDIDSSIVVFDDPYHNQDRSRRQCTIERIHNLVGLARQCFVFSHDLEFARAVEKRPGTQVKTFVLDSLTEAATLEPRALPLLPSQAYLKNYHRLRSYSENPANHREHLNEVANTLRIILEEYLRLKFPREWEENDWLGDMIRKIREAQTGTPLSHCHPLVEELAHINTYSQRFHHGGTGEVADEPEARELKTYVDRTLKVIHAGGNI
ncbi:AAA family ATPase [Microbulbifer thermotolerans]|uniref:AAA family ATPase n=1 Tax=Microbulbifer thermotolerans TaxID=252514 RepID=UPI002671DA77|nr:AAA family ATPase [Microbulbifer thermotolerans]WKT60571.1 AAA family ATPase [Microbulbifer thermotolerans]